MPNTTGKKVIYVDAETHRRLSILAAERGVTNGRIVTILVDSCSEKEGIE